MTCDNSDAAEICFVSGDRLRETGAVLETGELLDAVDCAWRGMRSNSAFGSKAVLSLPEETFWQSASVAPFREKFADERLGWKLSCLYSVNECYGGVKVIGANAFNRYLGMPRSTSTILLMEKRTLRPLVVIDGTDISARRTGTYATLVMEAFCASNDRAKVFLFGTGPTARAIVECLSYRFSDQIDRIVIRGRSKESATEFIETLGFSPALDLQAADGNRELANSCLVITATNARSPLFADEDIHRQAVSLHLGGDEVPEQYLQRVLRSGRVVCDDVTTVSRRNSQSLSLHFSRRGLSLEGVGPLIGIEDMSKAAPSHRPTDGPVCVTCVGLPMLDLYAAAATYEKYCRLIAASG